jgi:hypothetical protein
MPVSTARLSSGLRPGCRERRGFGGGSNGSMSAHRSSSSIGLAMSLSAVETTIRLTGTIGS